MVRWGCDWPETCALISSPWMCLCQGRTAGLCLALLKADPDLSSIPVIMITVEDNKNRGYILGTSEYMVKPIERDRLMSVLNRYRPDYLPCSVLVVEDNVEARRMMRRMLERERRGR